MSTVCLLERYTAVMISRLEEHVFLWVKRSAAVFFALIFFIFSPSAFAAMSSTNYMVQWDALSVGSSNTQSSSSYRFRSSLDSGSSASLSSSSSYALDGGYRGGVFDQVAGFRVYSQDTSTQVAATSSTSTTVVVTSSAAFAVQDRVVLVQDEGASQVTAVGKIASIAGTTLTVDAFTGGSPVIDGAGGDYLYKLTANSASLPLTTPTHTTVATGVLMWESTNDVPTGYAAYIVEDTDLLSGSESISDVSDGTVTAGVSEYGARASDASLSSSTFDTRDTGITSSPQLVASQSTTSFYVREYVTLKLGVSTSQQGGAYAHTITLLFAGNY